MFNIPKEVSYVINTLQREGYKAYIVGGCVRDYILDKQPNDMDITTDASPCVVLKIFHGCRVIETGIKHGTVTVVVNSLPIEITTFRIDSDYSDYRHPDSVAFTKNIKDDLLRRDFTINAMAYNEEEGLIDFYRGKKDISLKLIRCVGNPDERFNEDALRILRALRFSAILGFKIERKTKKAIFRNKHLLDRISHERITCEITKMLSGKNIKNVLKEYLEILNIVIPELGAVNYDAVKKIENVPYLKYAALLYNTTNAEKILRRLGLDNFTVNKATTLINCLDINIENDGKSIKRMFNKLTPEVFFELIKLKRAVYNKKYYETEKAANKILESGACFSLKQLSIDGEDLLKMGIKQGRKIGIILNSLLDMVIDEKIENTKDDLLLNAKLLCKELIQ